MAEFVFNIAKGRVAELHDRVVNNDPAASAIVLVAINRGAASDATMEDYDTLSALLGDAAVAEVTNTGYARKVLTDADLTASTVDDVNDRRAADTGDQTWTSVAAGDAWTDLVFCYDADTAAGTDANLVPLTCHPFAITPDGTDITVQVADYFRGT